MEGWLGADAEGWAPTGAGTRAGHCSCSRTTTSCGSTTATAASSCAAIPIPTVWRPSFPAVTRWSQFSPSRLAAVETVYAMTIHKSQGSQFDAAAVLLPEPSSRILTRELLYTAVTRARRELILAGTEESLRAGVLRPVARASGLRRRLWG